MTDGLLHYLFERGQPPVVGLVGLTLLIHLVIRQHIHEYKVDVRHRQMFDLLDLNNAKTDLTYRSARRIEGNAASPGPDAAPAVAVVDAGDPTQLPRET